jgi:hypothetical protein
MKKTGLYRGFSYISIGIFPAKVGKNNLKSNIYVLILHSEIRDIHRLAADVDYYQ